MYTCVYIYIYIYTHVLIQEGLAQSYMSGALGGAQATSFDARTGFVCEISTHPTT